jgi:hypothetical protein
MSRGCTGIRRERVTRCALMPLTFAGALLALDRLSQASSPLLLPRTRCRSPRLRRQLRSAQVTSTACYCLRTTSDRICRSSSSSSSPHSSTSETSASSREHATMSRREECSRQGYARMHETSRRVCGDVARYRMLMSGCRSRRVCVPVSPLLARAAASTTRSSSSRTTRPTARSLSRSSCRRYSALIA